MAEWWLARARYAVGDLYLGSPTESLELLADQANRLGLVMEGMWARLDRARLLAGSAHPQAAVELRRLGAEAEAAELTTIAALADQALRAMGVRTWRRGRRPDQAGGWNR
jgi:hypothetical protein